MMFKHRWSMLNHLIVCGVSHQKHSQPDWWTVVMSLMKVAEYHALWISRQAHYGPIMDHQQCFRIMIKHCQPLLSIIQEPTNTMLHHYRPFLAIGFTYTNHYQPLWPPSTTFKQSQPSPNRLMASSNGLTIPSDHQPYIHHCDGPLLTTTPLLNQSWFKY